MYSNRLVLAMVGISVPICLAAVITVLPKAQETPRAKFDVPDVIMNKVCGPRSDQEVALANWKEKISVRPFTFGARLTFANKALFGKVKTSKQADDQLMYLYGYEPETLWKAWQTVYLNDENSPKVSDADMLSFFEALHSGTQYAIVKKADANTSWWEEVQYSGLIVREIRPFEETISMLSKDEQGKIVSYVDPEANWTDDVFQEKARIWRDNLCVLSDISELGGMVALTHEKYEALEPAMVYYTIAQTKMFPIQEVLDAISEANGGASESPVQPTPDEN